MVVINSKETVQQKLYLSLLQFVLSRMRHNVFQGLYFKTSLAISRCEFGKRRTTGEMSCLFQIVSVQSFYEGAPDSMHPKTAKATG